MVAAMLMTSAAWASSPIVLREFVSDSPPTPASHASTLVQATDGTLHAAWFGGTAERAADVRIWVAHRGPDGWSAPEAVADGVQPDGQRLPTWNPVLFQPRHGPLLLFYKVGPDPRHWWGMAMRSVDDGRHWSSPQRLPEGVLGPIRNKPIQLANGDILSPSSTEAGRWRIHMERSGDGGASWQREPDLDDASIEAIQPTLLDRGAGHLLALGRTKQNRLFQVASVDSGLHWGAMGLIDLPNPNAAVDAVHLRDGRMLLVFNPAQAGNDWWDGRDRLDLGVSHDGIHWHDVLTLENEPGQEFSYPAIIQTDDGLVHISYTWKRQRIRHVVIDPARLP